MHKTFGKSMSFRTKAGMCIIEDESIVLYRTGIRGAMASVIAKIFAGIGIQRNVNRIPLTAIKRIESTPAVPAMTRAYFTVHFVKDEELHKRLIILPGIWGGGAKEYEVALEAFSSSGILVNAV